MVVFTSSKWEVRHIYQDRMNAALEIDECETGVKWQICAWKTGGWETGGYVDNSELLLSMFTTQAIISMCDTFSIVWCMKKKSHNLTSNPINLITQLLELHCQTASPFFTRILCKGFQDSWLIPCISVN